MKTFRYILPALILTIISLISVAYGVPKFTAQYEQKCNLCHISPTGGGMRNAYGSQFFALTEMAVHKTAFEDVSGFQTQVSDMISLGADMRTLLYYDENSERSSLFQMEGNFYVNAQLNEQFSLALGKGLYDGFEIYGMGYILPMQGYFRIGRFQPAYGWRFDDHTSFVREKMLWPAGSTDTGLELGFYPHSLSVNIGLFNGTANSLDNNKGKAAVGRIEWRHNIKGIGFGVGGSYMLNSYSEGNTRMFGPFGYLKLFKGRLIYIGEIDWLEDDSHISPPVNEATSHKLSYMLKQGIWLNSTYDFYDPDIDAKTGRITRYGFGFNYIPYGFLEIQPNLWLYQDDFAGEDSYLYFNTQFHFFF
ncbi:MAG: hypothetical protein GY839_14155 [candidate division Zixibacteria bacterium]|nr:hypothetical protein [candidate division Zixibacteria bacterium]